MVTKSYTISITRENEKQCPEAAQAAVDIIKALPHDDLLYLADLAKKKPNFVKKAKPYVSYL